MMKTRQKDFTKGDRDTQSCAAAQRFTRATECATIHWPFAPHCQTAAVKTEVPSK